MLLGVYISLYLRSGASENGPGNTKPGKTASESKEGSLHFFKLLHFNGQARGLDGARYP